MINPNYSIREMAEEDLDAVVSIISRCMGKEDAFYAKRGFVKYFSKNKTDPYSRYWVSCSNGTVIGVIGLNQDDDEKDDIFWVGWFAIVPKRQRIGIGSKLFTFMENVAIKQGARILYVNTSSDSSYKKACAFYKKQKFIQEARLSDYYEEGEDNIIFSKKLYKKKKE